jgi:hypothetical protein
MNKVEKWFVPLLLVGAGYWFLHEPTRRHPPGVLIPEPPLQNNLAEPEEVRLGDFTVTKLAKFRLAARVLSRERYYLGSESRVVPIDLALGWGPMSDSAVLDRLDIEQYDRWYVYHWSGSPPLSTVEIGLNSANMHMIPAADYVAATLKQIHRGDLIDLEGFLVRMQGPDGRIWQTSLSRADTGHGSCEIIYVVSVTIRPD